MHAYMHAFMHAYIKRKEKERDAARAYVGSARWQRTRVRARLRTSERLDQIADSREVSLVSNRRERATKPSSAVGKVLVGWICASVYMCACVCGTSAYRLTYLSRGVRLRWAACVSTEQLTRTTCHLFRFITFISYHLILHNILHL